MSQTVPVTALRIRSLLRDRVLRQPVFDTDEIVDAIERVQFPIVSRLPGIEAWNAVWMTLAAATSQYAIATADVQAFNHFRLTSTGDPVRKVEPAIFDELRQGNPVATGDPVLLSLLEKTDGTYTARVWPTPTKPDTIEALTASTPSSITIGSTLAYSRNTLRAIEYRVAAELLAIASSARLAEVQADKGAGQLYLATSDEMLRTEYQRLTSQRTTEGMVVRNPF